jgi:hypothetical protein
MDQTVGLRPLTAEAQVRSQDSQCEFSCGQSGSGKPYSPVLASSPGSITPPMLDLIIHLHLHVVLTEVQMDDVWVPSGRNAVSENAQHG